MEYNRALIPKIDSERFGELDVLRGLAAVSVLSYHYTIIYPIVYDSTNIPLFSCTFGCYGFHLFFMISGYVILMTLEKTSHPFDFVVARFSRLFPSYWAAVLLTFFITKYFWFYLNVSFYPSIYFEPSINRLLVNLSMFQHWMNVKNIDGSYWTLSAELLFYFLMFLAYLTKSLKYIELYGMAWLILMVLNKFFFYHFQGFSASFNFIFDNLLNYGNFFIAGILFYNLKTKGNKWYRHLGLGLCLLVFCAITGWKEFLPVSFLLGIFYLFIYLWETKVHYSKTLDLFGYNLI